MGGTRQKRLEGGPQGLSVVCHKTDIQRPIIRRRLGLNLSAAPPRVIGARRRTGTEPLSDRRVLLLSL